MRKRKWLPGLLAFVMLITGCTGPAVPTDPSQPSQGVIQSTEGTPTSTTATEGLFELKLIGDSEIVLEYGTEYEEPGVQATYNGQIIAVDVQVQLPPMDQLGEKTILYSATYNGITLELERYLRIVDTVAPIIVLLTDPDAYTEYGQEYVEEGFAATDNYDGDLTDRVVRTQEGDQITYTVSDSSGNTGQVQRQIVYVDRTAPQITLKGDSKVTITAGEKYNDPGCNAVDAVDGDLSDRVEVSGSYDRYQPGTYTLTYTVTDNSGNTASVQRKIVVKARVQEDTPSGDKVIYLTFDDGPSQYTPRLLEILAKYNVKATFFVVGSMRLEYLDDIVDAGHAIGIHTNTHHYEEIYVSEEAFFEDFYAVRQKIYDRTGVLTNLCRFPGGSSNRVSMSYCDGIMTLLTKRVEELGFTYFDWNVSSGDTGDADTSDKIYEKVISGIKGKDVAIVLQHDIYKRSVDAVERIIQWGLANGYTFKALDEDSPTCHHPVKN